MNFLTQPLIRTFRELTDPDFKALGVGDTPRRVAWPEGFDWQTLCASPRVLIVAEAGSGKTFECRARQQALWQAGEAAFVLEWSLLASTDLCDQFDPAGQARFDRWRQAQSEQATFFLDAVDELRLTHGSIKAALNRLGKALNGQLPRARFVITTRPVLIDLDAIRQALPVPAIVPPPATAVGFAQLVTQGPGTRHDNMMDGDHSPPAWRCVTLVPLDQAQSLAFMRNQGVSGPEALLQAINRQGLQAFITRPLDLMELCANWREQGRIGGHREQVEATIRLKLRARNDRAEMTPLTEEKALIGASRLALACLLTKKLSLRHSLEADQPWQPSPALDPARILSNWSAEERQTLLERPLFSFVNYGRVGFHHRSVMDYLAAKWLLNLSEQGLPIRALKRLLFTETAQGLKVVKPTLRPVAAWLATTLTAVCGEILKREPELLLSLGDPAVLSVDQRRAALGAFAERFGRGGWRGLHLPELQVQRFACPALGPEVRRLWTADLENTEVRQLLLQLIAAGPMPDCLDLALEVVTRPEASEGERLAALDALIALQSPRLEEVVTDMAEGVTPWSNRLLKGAILRLFPGQLRVDQLCRILRGISEAPHSIGDLSWAWPKVIAAAKIAPPDLEALRAGLTALIQETITWENGSFQPSTQRPDLVEPLAAVCLRQYQEGGRTADWSLSCVLATRLGHREYTKTAPGAALRTTMAQAPLALREEVFWRTVAFNQHLHPQLHAWGRFMQIVQQPGTLEPDREGDLGWVLAGLEDTSRPIADRALLLEVALWLGGREGDRKAFLNRLRSAVEHCPPLCERIEAELQRRPPDSQMDRFERETAIRREGQRREAEARHQAWQAFWEALVHDPGALFADPHREGTIWNLWLAMRAAGAASRASGWDRHFIESQFGPAIADRLRGELMQVWRLERPIIGIEGDGQEQDIRHARWQLGLAGIYAEAEDPGWATKLTVADAELAARYAPIELNGFPPWLEALATAHPGAVDRVLGKAFSQALDDVGTDGAHPLSLQYLRHAAPAVTALFIPRLFHWLEACQQRHHPGLATDHALLERQRRAVGLLLRHSDDSIRDRLVAMAEQALIAGLDTPDARIWLPVLMRLKPSVATAQLETYLVGHEQLEGQALVSGAGEWGIYWLAELFGDAHGESIDLAAPAFTPGILARLVRLAYRHVRPEDNNRHEGAFTPDQRDNAEHGRNALFNALMRAQGMEAWTAQMGIAEDPLFANKGDRIRLIAEEQAAEDADDVALSETDVRELDTRQGTPPMTQAEMFQLLVDRLDDLEDYLRGDESPRELWAKIEQEKLMRRAIAGFLKNEARGLYLVDQEGVTGEEKETDIRLRSTSSAQEAVIELKVAEKGYSVKDLYETINDQLVAKYLAPEERRSGCLLLTIKTNRTWKHPENGENLGVDGLLALLKIRAMGLERDLARVGKELRLDVRILDLRPAGLI